jgi:hypothetical protein
VTSTEAAAASSNVRRLEKVIAKGSDAVIERKKRKEKKIAGNVWEPTNKI